MAKMKAEDEQLLYKTILSLLREYYMNGGVRCLYKGKRVLFVPFILLVISDAKEYNILCYHYNSCGNRNVKCPLKGFKATFDELASTCPTYE